jgi:hypothetical protein
VRVNTQKAMNVVLLLGCSYEIVAILWRKIPTITRMLKLLGSKPVGKALLWMWCGYISWHFLEPLDS